tara:strand:- start:77 stop:493 length:417 start_codon:yes stop_codon:yes gene_type:complete
MKKLQAFGWLGLLSALTLACSNGNRSEGAPETQAHHADAEWSGSFDDPSGQARRALEKGDCRVYGLRAYSTSVPSVDLMFSEIQKRFGVVVIQGTTETPRNQAEVEFNDGAFRFARDYNAQIVMRAAVSCPEHLSIKP